MNDKRDDPDFDEDLEALSYDPDDTLMERVDKLLTSPRKRSTRSKSELSALRKLELLREQQQTQALTSDFEDYNLEETALRRFSVRR